MSKKTIITIYGRANEGKSETIKNLCRLLIANFPDATIRNHDGQPINYELDILLSIQIGNFKIGIESQGDPNSRMLTDDTIRYLIYESFQIEGYQSGLGNCDLIICASRTSGDTVTRIDALALEYQSRTLWKSSYYTPEMNRPMLNQIAAEELLNLCNLIRSGQL